MVAVSSVGFWVSFTSKGYLSASVWLVMTWRAFRVAPLISLSTQVVYLLLPARGTVTVSWGLLFSSLVTASRGVPKAFSRSMDSSTTPASSPFVRSFASVTVTSRPLAPLTVRPLPAKAVAVTLTEAPLLSSTV